MQMQIRNKKYEVNTKVFIKDSALCVVKLKSGFLAVDKVMYRNGKYITETLRRKNIFKREILGIIQG